MSIQTVVAFLSRSLPLLEQKVIELAMPANTTTTTAAAAADSAAANSDIAATASATGIVIHDRITLSIRVTHDIEVAVIIIPIRCIHPRTQRLLVGVITNQIIKLIGGQEIMLNRLLHADKLVDEMQEDWVASGSSNDALIHGMTRYDMT